MTNIFELNVILSEYSSTQPDKDEAFRTIVRRNFHNGHFNMDFTAGSLKQIINSPNLIINSGLISESEYDELYNIDGSKSNESYLGSIDVDETATDEYDEPIDITELFANINKEKEDRLSETQ